MGIFDDATIIETNTYYEGDRDTTEKHRKTLEVNGWTFADVDITDEFGTTTLPVKDGKWFTEMSVGKSLPTYDSFLALTHFKGHVQGGFGGSNKNIGIGCADGKEGKKWIHSADSGNQWGIRMEELMERISESTKATIDYFAGSIAYINVLRNMSVSCDCEGVAAAPVVTPNIGIVASLRPSPAQLHEGARHGQQQICVDRPGQRRVQNPARRCGDARGAVCGMRD